MSNEMILLKNIERFGEAYYERYLVCWDRNELERNWWEALT